MNLASISWPVFRLGEHKPHQLDGVTFYSQEYVTLDNVQSKQSLRVVDDTTVQGETLGQRRMRLAMLEEVNLFKIRLALYFLQDLIKIAKQTTWFIDSRGVVFQYRKSTRAKLTYHKLKKVFPVEGMGCIIEVEGIPQRFKCLFRPTPDQDYAGVLRWGLGYIIYGLYEQPGKPSYRKV
jgi:hypothetical protein